MREGLCGDHRGGRRRVGVCEVIVLSHRQEGSSQGGSESNVTDILHDVMVSQVLSVVFR